MKTIALILIVMAIAVNGYAKEALQVNSGGKDYTITTVPDQDIELEDNVKKYDITTYKKVKDVKDVEFTVINKTERIDIHQLDYDNTQDQNEIDRMTLKIPELQDRIAERNEMIADITAIAKIE